MIKAWFQLNEQPFAANLTADKLYQSDSFKEGLNRLEYLKQFRGTMLLTGPSGSGKTTLARYFADSLNPHQFKVFYTPLSTVSVTDFYRHLNAVLTEKYIHRKSDLFKSIQNGIRDWTQSRKIIPVILLDEAHLFRNEHFLELQIMFNFDYDSIFPLLLVLIGHPYLRDRLSLDVLSSFNRRITIKHHQIPYSRSETESFIHHALRIAGGRPEIIAKEAIDAIFQNTSGNPAAIGKLTLNALIAAAAAKKNIITPEEVFCASKEL